MHSVLLGLLFLLAPERVDPAGPPAGDTPAGNTLFGKPVQHVDVSPDELEQRRADFQKMLRDKGWVQIGDQVRPSSADGGFAQPPTPSFGGLSTPPHRNTIFLNFFGGQLGPGTNAARNESSCLQGDIDWPGFAGTEAQALALIDVFERQVEPYGIRIAFDEVPPPELPYAMVMMGGTSALLGLGGGVLGVSCSSDCADRWWRDTTFAFTGNINPNNASTLGTTALHEAAHAFGLAHIGDPTKVMNPFVGGSNVIWADSCVPYDDSTGGINCQPTHDLFCDGGAQDTNAELLAYFGPNSPDLEPPSVEITSPEDGLELQPGDGITVEAEISDNHEGVGWKLVIPEIDQESIAFAFEKRWELSSLPEGTYTVRVEAIDHDRNVTVDEVTIFVGVTAPETGSSSGGDESDASTVGAPGETGDSVGTTTATTNAEGSGEPPEEDDDASDTEDSTTAGGDDDDKGCGCRTDGAPDAALFGLAGLLLLLGVVRRRAA